MVLSTPKPSDDDREVPHLTLDGENSIVMEYVAPGWWTLTRILAPHYEC